MENDNVAAGAVPKTPIDHLTNLPLELLEQILLEVVRDILKLDTSFTNHRRVLQLRLVNSE